MESRKGNWSEEEDQFLSNTVIQYIQERKTQLEAFKDVAETIHRTPAACGYRWNAKLRNDFQEELKQTKSDKRADSSINQPFHQEERNIEAENPLQVALQYLECLDKYRLHSLESIQELSELKRENEQLKRKLAYFEQAYANAFPLTTKE